MGRGLLVLFASAGVLATPLIVAACVVGMWLRRTQRAQALRPFLAVTIAGTLSFLALTGAIGLLIAIAKKDELDPGYFDHHPLLPLMMIGLFLFALGTALLAALFAVWTFWSAFRPGAAPAAAAPARSAG